MAFGEVHVGLYGVASASRSWHDITHIYNKLEISRKETLSDTAMYFQGNIENIRHDSIELLEVNHF